MNNQEKSGQGQENKYGRRSFLKKIGLGLAALAVPKILGCGDQEYPDEYICRQEPEHSILKIKKDTKYGEILAGYPNLAKTVDYLRGIKIGTTDGYDILMDLLKNQYNPTQGTNAVETQVSEWTEKYKGLTNSEKQFILTVAQSLYVEANGMVPWSLRDYTEEEIDALFYVSRFHGASSECKQGLEDVPADGMLYKNETVELETAFKLLPLALKVLKDNPNSTIEEAVRWVKTNFFHAYKDWISGEDWGFGNYPDKVPENLEHLFDERIVSCREPSLVLVGLLRALNIPSFAMETPEEKHHGATYLPTVKKFVHGDHLATLPLIPTDLLFLDLEEVESAGDDDSMLYDLIQEKVKKRYGNNKEAKFLTAVLFRDKNTLGFRQINGEAITQGTVLETMQKEAPQYGITLDESGKIKSNFIKIQSLQQLCSDTG